MKTTKFALVAALGLMALVAPSAVRADEIVSVTLSNVTFAGASVCGPSGTAVCTETFSGSFLWDNTTAALVPGTGQVSSAGALLGPPFAFLGATLSHDLFGLPEVEATWTKLDFIPAIVMESRPSYLPILMISSGSSYLLG